MFKGSENLRRLFRACERTLRLALMAMSSLALFLVMILTVIDVFGRYFFNSPVKGGTELTELGIAITVISAVPIITWDNKHIVVDIFDRFISSKTFQNAQYILSGAISAVGYYVIGNRIYAYAARSQSRNEMSEYLEFPASYLQYFVSGICFITAMGLLLFVIIPKTAELLIHSSQ